ncbi:MAG: hypothetical protein LUI07_03755 [Lachnospiraceae bacterium]|nr:hypothetical protein [Lachnospiraceae bacterium]
MENMVYRPFVMDVLFPIGRFIARVADSLLDFSVVGLRKTVYKDSPLPQERMEGNWLTDVVGSVLNVVQNIANRTWKRRSPTSVNYRHTLAVRYDVWKESNMVIERSLSFGLLLVIIGFTLTLIYILWW